MTFKKCDDSSSLQAIFQFLAPATWPLAFKEPLSAKSLHLTRWAELEWTQL